MILHLKELRKAEHLSQTEFAKKIGVNIRTVGAWERGETVMSAEQLWNCAEALGTDPNTLLGWYDEHPEDLERATPEERALVESLRQLSDEGQEVAANVVAGLADRYPREEPAPRVRSA